MPIEKIVDAAELSAGTDPVGLGMLDLRNVRLLWPSPSSALRSFRTYGSASLHTSSDDYRRYAAAISHARPSVHRRRARSDRRECDPPRYASGFRRRATSKRLAAKA